MAKSAEMVWLDAVEAEQSGDRDAALEAARETVAIDPDHADAWMGVPAGRCPLRPRGGRRCRASSRQRKQSQLYGRS